MKKIFLDTNILIDLVGNRTKYDTGIANITSMQEFPSIYISALSVPTAYYVLKMKINTTEFFRLSQILSVIEILPLTNDIILDAMKYKSPDYEDSLQYITAIDNGCNYILTRDKKDFDKIKRNIPSKIKIITNISQIK